MSLKYIGSTLEYIHTDILISIYALPNFVDSNTKIEFLYVP